MTFDAHEFINDTRREIAALRSRSSWLKLAADLTAAVVVVIAVMAFLQAMLITIYGVAVRYHSDKWQNNAKDVWVFFAHYTGPLWSFVRALPLPKTLPSNDYWAPWALTLFFYLCIMLFCTSVKTRSRRLKETASEAEKNLNFQAPLLMQMSTLAAAHGTAQSASVGSVSGTGNIVSATNTINHILHKAEEKQWWERPLGLLGMAVAAAAINKMLHFS